MKLSSPPARLARTLVNRAVGDELRTVRVLRGVARGRRLRLNLSVEKAYWLGHYEPEVQQLLVGTLRPGDVMYDVGAHVGFFSVCAAALGAHVVAFEPDPANATRLRTNVELNALDVDVVEAAAWRETGTVALAAGDSAKEFRTVAGTGVASVTLDEVAAGRPAPTFLKIDVEGAEAEVLAGARDVLERHRPLVLCELHGEEQRSRVLELLRGYDVGQLGSPDRIVARP